MIGATELKKIFLILLAVSLVFIISACSSTYQNKDPITKDGKEFDVVFKNFDGSVLKTEKVNEGDTANPPIGLKRDGYKFVKWDKSFDNVTKDVVVKAVYEEITEPTLIVDTVYSKGEDVVVKVSVKNNPGTLTMLLNTIYVENAMELTKIESGKAMKGYSFVAPKKLSNACNAAWYINDVPDKITDGEIALLHFKLNKNVAPGAYEISISCDNGAFGSNYEEIQFDIINGYVVIENEEETK